MSVIDKRAARASEGVPRLSLSGSDGGFTLVEVTTSVAVMLIVLTAAWLLLTVTTGNLNTVTYGGQSSEINRQALAQFERDIDHAVVPHEDVSPVLVAEPRTIKFLADTDKDNDYELVTWTAAEDEKQTLLRIVTEAEDPDVQPASLADFEGGVSTTQTVLTGLANDLEMHRTPVFSYALDATTQYYPDSSDAAAMRRIGLVTFHLRNGLPDANSNVTDRTGAYRVLALVINGY